MILLVDDEVQLLELYTHFLEIMGHTVIACSSPEKAIEKAHAHKGEITHIITDYLMPSMQGDDLIHIVRGIITDIYVIIVTGYSPELINIDAPILEKPFPIKDLNALLQAEFV